MIDLEPKTATEVIFRKQPNVIGSCYVCGRFIGIKEFESGKIQTEIFQDDHFGPEKIDYCHKNCGDN